MWKALTKFIGVIANGGYDVSSDARLLSSEMCERLVEHVVRGLDQVYRVPDLFSVFSLGLEVRDEKMHKTIQTDDRFNYCIGFIAFKWVKLDIFVCILCMSKQGK